MATISTILLPILTTISRFWVLITLLLVILVSFLTLWPADQLYDVVGSDKFYHFTAYLSLAFPAALARPVYWPRVMLALVAMGGTIELIQPYVTRSREWGDFFANSTGVVLGILIAVLCRWLVPAIKSQKA